MPEQYVTMLRLGTYLVTRDGKVIDRYTNKEVPHAVTEHGFHRVLLKYWRDNKAVQKWFYVHKLVATAFVYKPDPSYTTVIHIDGDKANNAAENLKWCESHRSAVKIAHEKERYDKEKMKAAAKKQIVAVDVFNNRKIEFSSVLEAALWISTSGLTTSKLSSIRSKLSITIKKPRPSAYGYMWYKV